MKKSDVVKFILAECNNQLPKNNMGTAFAPTNIALCKYWGKRNQDINLPMTSSLSISLGDKGATTSISLAEKDKVMLNQQPIDMDSTFAKRLLAFLDLFRTNKNLSFNVETISTVPIAAGLASSACGFASIVMALNQLFGWELSEKELSIFARLGSGSASRSIWQGFVEWHAGKNEDGMDSYAEPFLSDWPEFCIGLLIVSDKEKTISSREAMQRTVTTSTLYSAWSKQVEQDLPLLKSAIRNQDFASVGKTAEANALAMHATMMSSWPPVIYNTPDTLTKMQKVWQLRADELEVYFTQDAGPNLKLLFLAKDRPDVEFIFPEVQLIQPFKETSKQ